MSGILIIQPLNKTKTISVYFKFTKCFVFYEGFSLFSTAIKEFQNKLIEISQKERP